jgi:predicted lipoprotein with Yx(FWY)xxD motif
MAVAVVASACGGGTADVDAVATESPSATTSEQATTTPDATLPPSPPAASGLAVTVGESEFGPMLFDESGQAIYLFEVETDGSPRCYGGCATAWPPVLTTAAPRANGVRADLLGTVARDDGSTQVTYGGHPLYFYAHEGPGQVLCHDVVENGGRWLVVTPEGVPAPA